MGRDHAGTPQPPAGDGSGADPERLPNLVIAGVSKAGTTSLFHYLAQHPEICTADDKELRYFTPLRYGDQPGPLDAYARRFPVRRAERYAMEATPGYFYGGRVLAEHVRRTLPDPRVIVSLRDPVERCWSWFRFVQSRARLPKTMTFAAYLDRCEELHAAGVDGSHEHQVFWGLGGGCYDTWVDEWADVFGDDLSVVFFDDVAGDPRSTVAGLCDWLGLDSEVAHGFEYHVENKTEQYRNARLQRAALLVNRRTTSFFLRHRALKRSLRRAYYAVNRQQDAHRMSARERQRLTAFYRPHNERLARSLRRLGHETQPAWLAGATSSAGDQVGGPRQP